MLRENFETSKDTRRWWQSPHPLLSGLTPYAAAKTPTRAERGRDKPVSLLCGGVV